MDKSFKFNFFFLDKVMAFVISENLAIVISLLIANLIEKKYGKIKRY